MRRLNVREVLLSSDELQLNDSFNEYLDRNFSIMEAAFYAMVFWIEDHVAVDGFTLDPAFVLYLSDNTLAWDPRAKQLLDRCSRLPVWGVSSNGSRRRETVTHLDPGGCSPVGRDFILQLGKDDGTVFFHEWVDEISSVNCPRCLN